MLRYMPPFLFSLQLLRRLVSQIFFQLSFQVKTQCKTSVHESRPFHATKLDKHSKRFGRYKYYKSLEDIISNTPTTNGMYEYSDTMNECGNGMFQ